MAAVFVASGVAAWLVAKGQAFEIPVFRSGPHPWMNLILRLDILSSTMVLLVSFLGWVTTRFSVHYLEGDHRQTRFVLGICQTQAAVLALVMSGSLGLILIAWVATSLSLHRLLLFFPGRAGAIFSARKKFVVSRLGDLFLLSALILIFRHYGTTELGPLMEMVGAGDTAPLPGVGFLLAACACLKSAQFPFHSWLPDTMETPTPVSALMHAGIVNAGGFLILRLSPLMVHAPAAMNLLAVIGALTAAFGAVVMLTQPSVKRALAYSTIAQMGFMLLQCGVGAFSLALLHIVAHSLYKANAFLRAGSTIGATPRAAIPLQTRALGLGLLGAMLLVTAATTVLHLVMPGVPKAPGFFGLIVALALAYALARIGSTRAGASAIGAGVGVATLLAAASFGLHGIAIAMFARFPAYEPNGVLVAALGLIFVTLFLIQALLWRADRHAFSRRLHVHVLNGLYIGTLANRALDRLWPRANAS